MTPTHAVLRARLRPALALLFVAVVAALVLSLAAAPASEARVPTKQQVSIMQDDDQLLYRGTERMRATLRAMKLLGVDAVRVTVLWRVVAEKAKLQRCTRTRSGRRRCRVNRRFRGQRPSSYPKRNWDRYDLLVQYAERLGIQVLFNVTGPGPAEFHRKPNRRNRSLGRSWRPDPTQFSRFVQAVGTRFNGRFRDARVDGRVRLPAVRFWSIWNEPNQSAWLAPQASRVRGLGVVPQSPIVYRTLLFRGIQGLEQSGHRARGTHPEGRDFIFMGETAPLGGDARNERFPLRPGQFLREMFCLAPNGQRYTGRAAQARRCSDLDRFREFRVTGLAHHPYTKDLAPFRPDSHPDSITLANIGAAPRLLDAIAQSTGHLRPGLPVILTEFGYESAPDDPLNGVPRQTQANWINEGDFLAYLNPRVVGQAQFQLRDVPPNRRAPRGSRLYYFTYQSGLLTARGRPKEAAQAYTLPLVVLPTPVLADGTPCPSGRTCVRIWGQLRFLPNKRPGDRADLVQLRFKPRGGSEFRNVGAPVPVNTTYNFFDYVRVAPAAQGTWRAVWANPQAGQNVLPAEVRSRDVVLPRPPDPDPNAER